MSDRPPEVFISYANEDEEKASRLSKELKSEGFKVWFAAEDLEPGDDLKQKLRLQINDADAFLACLSNAYVKKFSSSWLRKELRIAIKDEGKKRKKKIIPVRLEVPSSGPRAKVPEPLGSRAYADLSTDEKWKKNFPRLVAAIKKLAA